MAASSAGLESVYTSDAVAPSVARLADAFAGHVVAQTVLAAAADFLAAFAEVALTTRCNTASANNV